MKKPLSLAVFLCIFLTAPCAFAAGIIKTALAFNAIPSWLYWDTSHAGTTCSLTGFTQTFNDNFSSTSDVCTNGRVCNWYPSSFSYGFSTTDTYPSASYAISGGVLSLITTRASGSWKSGGLQSIDYSGNNGFSQSVPATSTGASYYESSVQYPYPVDSNSAAWPAFWLNSSNSISGSPPRYAELDADEGYETSPSLYSITALTWIGGTAQSGVNLPSSNNIWDGTYHKVGIEINHTNVIGCLDRVEVGRFYTAPQDLLPLYMRLNNALFASPSDTTVRTMLVNNVSVYSHP